MRKFLIIPLMLVSCFAQAGDCQLAELRAFSAIDLDRNGEATAQENQNGLRGWEWAMHLQRANLLYGWWYRYDVALRFKGGIDHEDMMFLLMAAKGSYCNLPQLRAYSWIDKKKNGSAPDYNYASRFYSLVTDYVAGRGQAVLKRYPAMDFDRDGQLDEDDYDALHDVFGYARLNGEIKRWTRAQLYNPDGSVK